MNTRLPKFIDRLKKMLGLLTTSYSVDYWAREPPGVLWRAILARSPTDGRGIRRWQQWDWWNHPRTPAEWCVDFGKIIFWPLLVVIKTQSAIAKYGKGLKERYKVPYIMQWAQIVLLQVKYGVEPVSYYKFRLFREDKRQHAVQFVEDGINLLRVVSQLCPDAPDREAMTDKRSFERWCRENGWPFVPTVAEFAITGAVTQGEVPFPRRNLLSKPTDLEGGRGIRFWEYQELRDEPTWSDMHGREVNEQQLIYELAEIARADQQPIMLQECLTNHWKVQAMGNGRLCTIRIITARFRGRHAMNVLAVIRIPTADSVADNFDLKNLAAAVDLEDGRCGAATRKHGEHPLPLVDQNPETQALIRGHRVPFWDETVRLTRLAHDSLECQLPIIGWDVAILDKGPVLIEANAHPCNELAQLPTGVPLGKTVYAECLIADLCGNFGIWREKP